MLQKTEISHRAKCNLRLHCRVYSLARAAIAVAAIDGHPNGFQKNSLLLESRSRDIHLCTAYVQ